jgi:hypothetical protein
VQLNREEAAKGKPTQYVIVDALAILCRLSQFSSCVVGSITGGMFSTLRRLQMLKPTECETSVD